MDIGKFALTIDTKESKLTKSKTCIFSRQKDSKLWLYCKGPILRG